MDEYPNFGTLSSRVHGASSCDSNAKWIDNQEDIVYFLHF